MFKKHSFNVKLVKDQPTADDTETRAKEITANYVNAELYARVGQKFVTDATNTIVAGVVGIALVKTTCVIAILIVKKIL